MKFWTCADRPLLIFIKQLKHSSKIGIRPTISRTFLIEEESLQELDPRLSLAPYDTMERLKISIIGWVAFTF